VKVLVYIAYFSEKDELLLTLLFLVNKNGYKYPFHKLFIFMDCLTTV